MWPVSELSRQYYEAIPHADSRTKNWLLVENNPVYVWILSASYLLFVWLGPKFMANRKPWSLQSFLVVYNFSLVFLSLYMTVEILLSIYAADYTLGCVPYNAENKYNPKELRIAKVLWWYFFSKAIELLDTVIMILRKKNDQVSFLHVFHHVSMLNIWWWSIMFIPGGLSWMGACVNCMVHVVMYLYYALAAIPAMRGKLWWKKHITKFQLIQFVIILYHTVFNMYNGCDFPAWGKYMLSSYMVILLVLFTNFYARTYKKKQISKANGKISNNGTHVELNGHGNMANGFHEMNGNYEKGDIIFKED